MQWKRKREEHHSTTCNLNLKPSTKSEAEQKIKVVARKGPEFYFSEPLFKALFLERTCLPLARCGFCDKPINTTLSLETYTELSEY